MKANSAFDISDSLFMQFCKNKYLTHALAL